MTSFLRDPENTEFILVTIPEGLGVYQARRLIREFARFGLDIRYVVVNNVVQNADSDFNRERMEMQQGYIQMLRDEHGDGRTILEVPLFAREIKGVERLRELERVLFAG